MMKKILSVFLSVLLICTTGINLLLSSAALGDAPVYQVFDFEDGNEPASFTKYFAESISSTSIATENAISGSNSYKVTFTAKGSTNNDGFLGIVLTEGLSSQKTYRVSGKYRVLSGTLGYFRVVNVGARSDASHFYNDAVAANRRFDVSVGTAVNAFDTPRSFSGVITPTSSNGNISIGVRPSTSATTTGMELLIDDITIAEIIDAPTATADANMGTATVSNKSGKSDYAVGETAVFTATPNAGYSFSHWADATGAVVSTSATYEHTLTGATTLTAHFALDGIYTFDFEDGKEPASFTKYFAESISSTSIETANPISGNDSYKVTFTAKGSNNSDGFLGIVLKEGLSAQKTYRVSGKYRVLSGTLGYFRVVNVGSRSDASPFFNDAVASNRRFDVSVGTAVNAFDTPRSFSGVITPTSSNGNISIGVRPSTSATTTGMELLIDDITIAEIVTVSAGVNEDTMGTATVTNKAGHTNYAVGDTAVFTATPKEGYVFSHWQDATGASVATTATYEAALTGATALTAVFVAEEEESAIVTAHNNAVAIRTAQASSTGKQGMRVYNSIKKATADAATEYGSIAIRADYLETVQAYVGQTDAEFDLELYDAFKQKYGSAPGFGRGVSYQTGGTPILWETTETDYIFTSYLTGIDKQYYGDTYLIRSYMIDAEGNVTYGDIYEASVFNTVYNILQQETEGDGYDAAMAIIAEAGQDNYDAWVSTYPAQ